MDAVTHPHWPLFDLEVRTPRLALRYVDDPLATELATLAAAGIHDPAFMPFSVPWTDAPSPALEREAFRYWWRCRAETAPERWQLNLAVIIDGVVVGATNLGSREFAVTRTFGTGSWLGQAHQGRGIGTELRQATLHLGFAGFGAEFATTAAFVDNLSSLGVTRRLGYAPNGTSVEARRGTPSELLHFRLSRAGWERIRRDDIALHGVQPCREILGL
jgi:RimJ/RimL family protein N-acetyltransferase